MEGRQNSGLLSKLERLLEGKWSGWVINLLVIPGLLIASLLLPPISLKERVFEAGYTLIDRGGGSVVETDGTQVTFPSEGIRAPARVQLSSVPRTEFLEGSAGRALRMAAEKIPPHLVMRSPFYQLSVRGQTPQKVVLSIPIPNDSEPYPSLDLYEWTGEEWKWHPRAIVYEDDLIEAQLSEVPANFAVFQSSRQAPAISADWGGDAPLPAQANEALGGLDLQGLYLGGDGSIIGTLPAQVSAKRDTNLSLIPTVRNWGPDGVVRSDLVDNLLISPEQQQAHIEALVNLVVGNVFPGVEIYYRGFSPDLQGEFTNFMVKLAGELHARNKTLTVRVDTPRPVSEDLWDTAPYDWVALGKVVDGFRFELPRTPDAWRPAGSVERLLAWAVGKVNRYKIQPILSTHSLAQAGTMIVDMPYSVALSSFSQVEVGGKTVVNPGQSVTFALKAAADSGGIQIDRETSTYFFTHTDAAGQTRTIYLENATSLAHKLRTLMLYNLGGVTFQNLIGEENDLLIWPVVREYHQMVVPPVESKFTALWTVRRANGQTISSNPRPLQESVFNWTAPTEPGEYMVDLSISDDGGKTTYAGTRVAMIVASPTPTFTPSPTPTLTPTPTPKPTDTPVPTKAPTATPRPQTAAQPTPSGSGSPPPAPRVTNFGFGIQAHWWGNDHATIVNHIKAIGFNWTKQQVEWKTVESGGKGAYDWGELDRIVNSANANGINILLSVVKSPVWARPAGADLSVEGPPANPQDFADFLGAMAARYKGRVQAYEVWNEQNLHYEWGNQPINAAQYVDLLKRAYLAIKAADPNAIVVSGALTPTGVNDGRTAIDDVVYLEQMYQAGLKNYCDAIGAHPSGYNNPPDAKFGYNDPLEPAFKNHPSFFFRDTMERYRNVMVVYGDSAKKIWPTEFGWASIENLTPTPARGYEYAANVTEAEQAQYVTRAYEMARNWGWVGAMFLWNLNFAPVSGPADEKAAFGIVRGDWSPRPVYAALASMPK